jgi:hypothetical protein
MCLTGGAVTAGVEVSFPCVEDIFSALNAGLVANARIATMDRTFDPQDRH